MSTELVTIDFAKPLPVFPTADAVLLPQAIMPLHVFEPRYRQMVNDVLDTTGLIAMGLFRGAVSPEEYESGRPAIRPFVCVGQVREYERLDDGRFVLLLQGVCRARVLEEVNHEPYRVIRAVPAHETPTEEGQLSAYRSRIQELLQTQLVHAAASSGQNAYAEYLQVATPIMVDLTIAAVCSETDLQYKMLAQPDVRRRAEWLIERMESLLGRRPGDHAQN